ncbi:hypothetical protein [Nocardia flavorosea]|uniref:DUF732 domain-containing protein n=1 Tax=Nocardia flavorosea TaxID=53429 RepID=A0A846YI61_9NOCA|nr:hypothetical protein [Nocardia flavorosea]NKY57360.1 hypothetical protein [Nocardia flavorosea]
MKRPSALLPAVLVAFAVAATACQSDGAEPDTAATSSVANPDTAKIDQVKAGSFVIGFRGAFPGLAEGRDDAAITTIFTDTCADIRSGTPEDEATAALTGRLDAGGTAPAPQETEAVYQMVAAMCGQQ